jgi:hypothetical protein
MSHHAVLLRFEFCEMLRGDRGRGQECPRHRVQTARDFDGLQS